MWMQDAPTQMEVMRVIAMQAFQEMEWIAQVNSSTGGKHWSQTFGEWAGTEDITSWKNTACFEIR